MEEAEPVIPTLDNAEALIEELDDDALRASVIDAIREAQEKPSEEADETGNADDSGGEASATAGASTASRSGTDSETRASAVTGDAAEGAGVAFAYLVSEPTDDPDGVIVARQQQRLESEVLAHGDDGLLERLAALADDPGHGNPWRSH